MRVSLETVQKIDDANHGSHVSADCAGETLIKSRFPLVYLWFMPSADTEPEFFLRGGG